MLDELYSLSIRETPIRDIIREDNTKRFVEGMAPYVETTYGFYPEEWLADTRNIALTDGNGNYNLLQYDSEGVYFVHVFYGTLRGKEAIKFAKECQEIVFTEYPVEVLKGLTPLRYRAARWFNRKVGFKSYGALNTTIDPCEVFILTKKEYLNE